MGVEWQPSPLHRWRRGKGLGRPFCGTQLGSVSGREGRASQDYALRAEGLGHPICVQAAEKGVWSAARPGPFVPQDDSCSLYLEEGALRGRGVDGPISGGPEKRLIHPPKRFQVHSVICSIEMIATFCFDPEKHTLDVLVQRLDKGQSPGPCCRGLSSSR